MTRPLRTTRANTRANTRKDYSELARKKITSPSKVAESSGGVRRPSILVYSRNKKGKTRFCLTAGKGKVLVVDPEHGTDRFLKADPHVWHLESWEEIDDIYKFLRSGDHSYEWVAFDGSTRIANMALRYVTKRAEETDLNRKPGQVTQRDYGNAGVPMAPLVWGEQETKDQMLWYTLILIPLTLLPVAFGAFGWFYFASALALGVTLLVGVLRVRSAPQWNKIAWKVYKFSLLYLALLFVAMVIDQHV